MKLTLRLAHDPDEGNRISALKILNELKSFKGKLPDLVFVNSCYSENVGRAFSEIGVKYVIMINSKDKIKDDAAQIFSEHFYNHIFKG